MQCHIPPIKGNISQIDEEGRRLIKLDFKIDGHERGYVDDTTDGLEELILKGHFRISTPIKVVMTEETPIGLHIRKIEPAY